MIDTRTFVNHITVNIGTHYLSDAINIPGIACL